MAKKRKVDDSHLDDPWHWTAILGRAVSGFVLGLFLVFSSAMVLDSPSSSSVTSGSDVFSVFFFVAYVFIVLGCVIGAVIGGPKFFGEK